jgi:very-short-patch-repair endonuclease
VDIAALCACASRQHGLVQRVQAHDLGWGRHALAHRVSVGELIEETPLVLRIAGAPRTREQQMMLAVLDAGPGACISHQTAAAAWRSPGHRIEPVHVWRVRGRSNHPSRRAVQHKTRLLPEHHVSTLRGIPITTPSRTFVDLAAVLPVGRAARLLDDLWARNLTNFARLDRMLAELSKPGRTGLTIARILVQERGPGYRPPESGLERRAIQVLADEGITGFERQVDVGDDDRWIGRVDLRHAIVPLIVEVQSDLYHWGRTNEAQDSARITALEAAGYVVIEVEEFDVWHRPTVAAAAVRSGFETATERLHFRTQTVPGTGSAAPVRRRGP